MILFDSALLMASMGLSFNSISMWPEKRLPTLSFNLVGGKSPILAHKESSSQVGRGHPESKPVETVTSVTDDPSGMRMKDRVQPVKQEPKTPQNAPQGRGGAGVTSRTAFFLRHGFTSCCVALDC